MSQDNLLIRSLHDVGLAAWFGGSLMGAIGLNGAASDVSDRTERSTIAADGWARWAPVNAAAIAVHAIGGVGLIRANASRVVAHSGSRRNTVVKTALTGAAVAATAYNGWQGAKTAGDDAPSRGATEPSQNTPEPVASAQQRLRVAQWLTPVLTGALIVLGAQQGEQQRPAKLASDLGRGAAKRLRG